MGLTAAARSGAGAGRGEEAASGPRSQGLGPVGAAHPEEGRRDLRPTEGAAPGPPPPCDKWEAMQEDIDRVFGESHEELALLGFRLLQHTPDR